MAHVNRVLRSINNEDASLCVDIFLRPEGTVGFEEYRRDVARYLNEQQPQYPTLPWGYLSAEATGVLAQFRERALASRSAALLESFPFAAVAAGLRNSWRASAVALYRNWLALISARRATDISVARTSGAAKLK